MHDPLAGAFSVDDSARRMRHYRYAAERSMRALGGWIALTPELPAKLLLGRHVWDLAQHADAFGKRLPELRAHAQVSEPPGPPFAAFMDALESPEAPEQSVERLVGVYRVLKPHVLAVYEEHLERANAVYEPPTRRILLACAEDERRHVAAGEIILEHLITAPALRERATVWRGRLEGLLAASGGVTGEGLPAPRAVTAPATHELGDDAREWIRLAAADAPWPIPPALRTALALLGDAVVAGDAAGVGRWLAPGVRVDADALGAGRFERHVVVAFASLGHDRLVKIRLDGVRAGATLLMRWAAEGGAWRVTALEVSRVEAARSA